MQLKSSVAFLVLISSFSALATQPLATFSRQPILSGNGCPQGSYSAALSPDNTAVSIIFDRFSAMRSATQPGYESKFCSITLPVQVTPGYQIKLKTSSLRGFSSISSNSLGKLLTIFSEKSKNKFFSALSTLKFFQSNFNDEFEIRSPGRLPALGCQSSSVEFSFTNWVDVYAQRNSTSNSILTLDSFDLSIDPTAPNSQVEITRCR